MTTSQVESPAKSTGPPQTDELPIPRADPVHHDEDDERTTRRVIPSPPVVISERVEEDK